MKKSNSKQPYFDYICSECANEAAKGNKSSNLDFTMHIDKCDKCKKETFLGHVRDFGLDNQLVFKNLKSLD